MRYIEIESASALHKLKRKMPYGYDLNIYKGCEHGCRYCYAFYAHPANENGEYDEIHAKTHIVEALERELSAPGWNRDIVNIGGVTDSYQPCEKQFALMPDILRLFIKYKTPVFISTKSDLALRDYELLDELSRITLVNIASSIVTVDEDLRRKMEPGAAPAGRRLALLREFKKTNAMTSLLMMPIVPHLTDGEENIEALLGAAKDIGVDCVLPGTMYLRGATTGLFFRWLESEYPAQYPAIQSLYAKGGAGPEYKDGLYARVNALRKKYGIKSGYAQTMREKMQKYGQISIFD